MDEQTLNKEILKITKQMLKSTKDSHAEFKRVCNRYIPESTKAQKEYDDNYDKKLKETMKLLNSLKTK